MKGKTLTRRTFVGAATASIPLATLTTQLRAQELRELTPDDPRYAALGYVPDVSTVDPAAEPLFKPGSNCENCAQIQGEEGAKLRPCALFPDLQNPTQMLLVEANGWCRSWIAKA